MVPCSASSGPLTHLTRHLETDRQLYRDRFILDQNAKGYQTFRTRRRQHNQAIDEFFRFNSSSSNLRMPDSATRQRQLDFEIRSSPQLRDSHTSGLAWTSEFNSRNLGIKRASISQSQLDRSEERNTHILQNQFQSSKIVNEHAAPKHRALCDFKYDHHSTTNLWQCPHIGIGRDSATRFTTDAEQTRYPSINLEKTMEDFDWEALFASLDTTTPIIDKSEDISRAAVPNNPNSEALVTDEVGYSVTESVTYQVPNPSPEKPLLSSGQYAFERGMRIVCLHDNLSLAVLAFKEACRAEPIYFDAWKMLGSVLAEVQRETEAIVASKEALKLEPNNLEVIMRLAVSYTNEGAHRLACQCLERWIRIKYPQISVPALELQSTHPSHSELFDRIKGPFIQAARLSLGEESIDTDVQVGLGVLMFAAEFYEMAADCFHAAIQSTEPGSIKYENQQHLLWNRYAVCLGNIRDKEDMAIQAYETALALKPNFVKARCNLGVLYHNKNQPLTGARNILDGLMWKRTVGSITAENTKVVKSGRDETLNTTGYDDTTDIYETLMKCCNSMCRWDLAELVGPNMDLEEFRLELDGC